jgi:hypothetical protein
MLPESIKSKYPNFFFNCKKWHRQKATQNTVSSINSGMSLNCFADMVKESLARYDECMPKPN